MRLLARLGSVLSLCLIISLGCHPDGNSTRIAVAASLGNVIPPLHDEFVESKMLLGEEVNLEIIYGGSGEMIAQQRHSGIFDAMFLASREAMIPLLGSGRLGGFSDIRLGNSLRLVVLSSSEASTEGSSLEDFLTESDLVAIGGLGVPAGDYARRWLNTIEGLVLSEVNLVEFPNVRAVVAAVESGAVSGGFVYATDVINIEGLSILSQWEPESGGVEYGYASIPESQLGADFGEFIGERVDQFVSAGFTVLLEGE